MFDTERSAVYLKQSTVGRAWKLTFMLHAKLPGAYLIYHYKLTEYVRRIISICATIHIFGSNTWQQHCYFWLPLTTVCVIITGLSAVCLTFSCQWQSFSRNLSCLEHSKLQHTSPDTPTTRMHSSVTYRSGPVLTVRSLYPNIGDSSVYRDNGRKLLTRPPIGAQILTSVCAQLCQIPETMRL